MTTKLALIYRNAKFLPEKNATKMKWKRKTDSLQPLSGISERNNASRRKVRSRKIDGARAGKRQSSVKPPVRRGCAGRPVAERENGKRGSEKEDRSCCRDGNDGRKVMTVRMKRENRTKGIPAGAENVLCGVPCGKERADKADPNEKFGPCVAGG